jgi:S-DNA-T family DNA segregation ATPase FtsK/SpoIIIE
MPLEIYRGDGADSDVQRIESARLAGRFAPSRVDDHAVSSHGAASTIATVSALVRGVAEPSYRRPSLTLLGRSDSRKIPAQLSQAALRGTARLLLDALAVFEVQGFIRSVRVGPVVTVLEFDPAPGVRSDRLLALGPDIARVMGLPSARAALVPGRSTVMFELPNATRDPIALRDVLETPQFRQPGLVLPVAAGRTKTGEPVVLDLARLPHVLIVGSASARPQVALDTIVLSQLFRHAPTDCRMLLIDPQVADLSVYNGIPHLVTPVVTQPAQALAALAWVVAETEERLKRLALLNARSLDVYNNRVRNARKRGERNGRTVQTGYEPVSGRQIFEQETFEAESMPHLIVVLGELADVLLTDPSGVEGALQRIARVGATVGVHMVAATDRATTDVLTPEIKRAFASRLCFKLPSRHASSLAIGVEGAEQLLADGDMLVLDAIGTIARIHSAVASAADVEAVVAAVLTQNDLRTSRAIGESRSVVCDDLTHPDGIHVSREQS